MTGLLMRHGPMLAMVAALAAFAGGCGPATNTGGTTKDTGKDKAVAKGDGYKGDGNTKDTDKKEPGGEAKGDHSGWWCDEHGLPEGVCDLCSKKYREAEKAKGNWCEHSRVKTSCFKCNPVLQAKYAAEYKAKFGNEPPAIEDEEKKDDGKGKDKK